jgi:hypothetical protein
MDPPYVAPSSRPFTSNGLRPSTSVGAFDRDPQYTYTQEYDLEEEEEESEDEDVFAFLPPSTAEQQQEQNLAFQQAQDQQDHKDQNLEYPPQAHTKAPSDPVFAHDLQSPPDTAISFPLPTFDPYTRYPPDAINAPAGPSTPALSYLLPQTPPSTESSAPDDPYRMRRMNAESTLVSHSPTSASTAAVHVSLPTGAEKDPEAARSRGKRNSSSVAESLSLSPSMIDDDDSGEGSIK